MTAALQYAQDRFTQRWTPMEYHATQQAFWAAAMTLLEARSEGYYDDIGVPRFNTLPCGRRTGKTEFEKRKLALAAIYGTPYPTPSFFAAAPVRDQAKRIFWDDLKALIPAYLVHDISETHLRIQLTTGSELWVIGLDKPERIEGKPWDGGVITEFANIKEEAWQANIRPALSDRMGWCDLEGVPEGRNHYYRTDRRAKAQMAKHGEASAWGSWHWTSEEILPLYGRGHEIEENKNDLDEMTYRQEFLASFVNFAGMCYHSFSDHNVARLSDRYRPDKPLIITMDFNVAPGTANVAQEMPLPVRDESGDPVQGTGILGEVHIERNSNTRKIAKKLVELWGHHPGRIHLYGDATGGIKGTQSESGSDWDIALQEFTGHFGHQRVIKKYGRQNPPVRSRVNAVNSRLASTTELRRLMVDGSCQQTIMDFEGVESDDAGDIDKDNDKTLTHHTDGIGYYIESEFPVRDRTTRRIKVGGT